MAKLMICPTCINNGSVFPKPYLKRDPSNQLMALCPVCGRHVDNGSGHIGFRGKPPKPKEPNVN